MFRSRRRALVYSQYEHARLAGALAQRWGNARFPRPDLPFASFVAGVALHDFGYGLLDEHPIGEMDHAERVATLSALIEARLADPVAETVALFHARRLTGDTDAGVAARCEARIDELLAATGIDRAAHAAADRITDLCDSVAFSFCFERAGRGRVAVPVAGGTADASTCSIEWSVDGAGLIAFEPWPLDVAALDTSVVAFAAEGYPDRLVPHLVPARVRPG